MEITPIPIPQKALLTIEEASAYSNIGINKMYELAKTPNCPFVLFVGIKRLILSFPADGFF